jgi:outer membrane protein assembly factor BamB
MSIRAMLVLMAPASIALLAASMHSDSFQNSVTMSVSADGALAFWRTVQRGPEGTVLLAPGADEALIGRTGVQGLESTASGASDRPPRPAIPTGVDDDWNNFGGNAARNGLTTVLGPEDEIQIWDNTDDFSIISWHPVTLGERVFAIRESGFPQLGEANDEVIAYDINTGEELWRADVPYGGDPDEEWIAYVGGAHGGKVYCARGGSGRTTPVYAFDAATGDLLWDSDEETVAGPQDGFVFAPNGDVLVGDFDKVMRLDATDGSTVWSTPRSCPVSGNCGCAVGGDGVYFDAAAPGGNEIVKLDLATGVEQYASPVMAGFTTQNAPFVGLDGATIYFARSQNNPEVDFLYAFQDTGSEFVELWNRPIRWTTSHEHGLGPDGSIYTFIPGDEFVRLDPATGNVLDTAGVLSPIGVNLSARTAVSSNGTVYVSNGWASSPAGDGRIWAFSADLSENLFTLELDRQNSGGPSLGASGTLVVADRVGIYGYWVDGAVCPSDLNDDDVVNVLDLLILLDDWGESGVPADLNDDGVVNVLDLLILLDDWGPC